MILLALGLFALGMAASLIRDDMKYIFYLISLLGSSACFFWLSYMTAAKVVESANGVILESMGLAGVFAILGVLVLLGMMLLFWWRLKQPFLNN